MKPLLRKSIKICCNYALAPLLFGWLAFSVGRQVAGQPQLPAAWLHIRQAILSPSLLLLVAAALLTAANWWLEARKWQALVSAISPISIKQSVHAVLSGVSFAISTPNRVGEYLGRLLYLPAGMRVQGAALSFAGSISQLLVTVCAGWAGMVWLRQPLQQLVSPALYNLALWLVGGSSLLLAGLYGYGLQHSRTIQQRLPRTWQRFWPAASFSRPLLTKLLWLSALRYTVFVVQYLLVFRFFGVWVAPLNLCMVMGVWFLALAAIPTIALAEAGVRGQLGLLLVGLFSSNGLGIASTALVVWLLNLVLPALAGIGLHLKHRMLVHPNHDDAIFDPPAVGASVLADAGGSARG